MPWARFDERYPGNRKIRRLSDAAFRLDVSAICWSNEHLTNGKIPDDDLDAIGDVKRAKSAANELVRKGRWEQLDDGYQIHDFLEYNPSREKVLAQREAKRKAGQKGGVASGAARAGNKQDASSDEAECFDSGSEGTNTRPVPSGSKEPVGSRKKRATPPPDIYPINDEMRAWAEEHAPSVMLVVETAKMLDWARGGDHKKVDWLAAWRNWMRRRQDEINEKTARLPPAQDDDEAWMR
jgi:hypothetical protein